MMTPTIKVATADNATVVGVMFCVTSSLPDAAGAGAPEASGLGAPEAAGVGAPEAAALGVAQAVEAGVGVMMGHVPPQPQAGGWNGSQEHAATAGGTARLVVTSNVAMSGA